MSYDRTYRRTTTTTSRNARRPGYYPPPPPPPGGHNRHHSVLGYWVPLITIGTIAVGGLAAWVWSERGEHDEHDYPQDKPSRPPGGSGGPYPAQGSQPYYPGSQGPPSGPPHQQNQPPPGVIPQQNPPPPGMPPPVGAQGSSSYQGEASSYYQQQSSSSQSRSVQRNDQTFIDKVTGVMRRTPSPQQFFDSAHKQVTAGLVAAGSALGSIMEVDSNADALSERRERSQSRHDEREGFSDHERWSEEAEERQRISTVDAEKTKRTDSSRNLTDDRAKGKSKRTVAIVVSADVYFDTSAEPGAYHTEHASILSHLPVQRDSIDLFVLIYSPGLKSLPSPSYTGGRAPSTLGSSYSEINTPAQTPGSELQSISPRIDATDMTTKQFDALFGEALSLVPHRDQIMPFSTHDGYVHMLRHLAPQLVYISDTLSGRDGATVAQLKGWVGHTVLVVGDEGHGGLADTETETEDEKDGKQRKQKWWEHSDLVGLGKDIDVVDATRVGDDWSKRVAGRE